MDCLFCKIAKKEIPASIISEDSATVAFLDIHPRAAGHTMVVPKTHRETILECDTQDLVDLFGAVQNATALLKEKLKPDGFTIGINHGKASGQVIDHLHVHVIPRWNTDGGGSIHSVVDHPGEMSVEAVLEKLKM